MASRVGNAKQANGVARAPNGAPARKPAAAKAPTKKSVPQRAKPVTNKAQSVAGGDYSAPSVGGAYAIMASRIANRVAEMAEGITFVERPKSQPAQPEPIEEAAKKAPRKLEMRLNSSSKDSVAFSAPFLDNTLQKMLQLQNRMLTTTAELSKTEGIDEKVVREHAAQSAELSRIIALICAEKARQGA